MSTQLLPADFQQRHTRGCGLRIASGGFPSFPRRFMLLVLASLFCRSESLQAQLPVTDVQRAQAVSFDQEILPILQRSCLACHSASEQAGELVLENPAAMLKGGDSGAAIVPGQADNSLMFKVAAHLEESFMPPAGNDVNAPNLSPQELGLLRLWINQGAQGGASLAAMSPRKMKPLTGRSGPVNALAISPDGQYVVVGRNNQLVLVHTATGRVITELTDSTIQLPADHPGVAHSDLIQSLAMSDDGSMLASGSFREVKLWKKPADVVLQTLQSTADTGIMAVQPQGQLIAAAMADHSIQVWETETAAVKLTLRGFADAIHTLQFSDDGTQLLAAGKEGVIRIWNSTDGTLTGQLETPVEVNSLALVPVAAPTEENPAPGNILVSGGAENLLRTWNLPAAAPAPTEWTRPELQHLAGTPDGKLLLTTNAAGDVQLLQLAEANEQTPDPVTFTVASQWKRAAMSAVGLLRLPPEGEVQRWAVLAAADTELQILNSADGSPLHSWQPAMTPLTAVAAAADGSTIATGADTGSISLWKAIPVAGPEMAQVAAGTALSMQVSDTGRIVAVAAQREGRQEVVLWNLENGQQAAAPLVFDGAFAAMTLAADEKTLAIATTDGRIRIWKTDQPAAPQHELTSAVGPATLLQFSPDTTRLVYATADNKLHSLRPGTEDAPLEYVGHGGRVAAIGFLSPGEIWSVSADQTARIWNADNAAQTRNFSVPGAPLVAAISRDRQLLAAVGNDNAVRVFQVNNGQLLQTIAAHPQKPIALGFSADNTRLGICGEQGLLRFWTAREAQFLEGMAVADARGVVYAANGESVVLQTATGGLRSEGLRYLRTLTGIPQAITELQFHSNGQTLYATSADGTFRGFSVQNGQQAFAANHGSPIHDLAIAPGEQIFATAAENGVIRLWQGNGGGYGPQQINGPGGPLHSVTFSADALTVICGTSGEQKAAAAYTLADGQLQQRYSILGNAVTDVRPVGTAGRLLLTDSQGTRLVELNAVRSIPGHGGAITDLAVHLATPQQVFSSSLDGTARLWNLTNGQQLRTWAHGGPVNGLDVRADGQRLVTAGENARLRLWNINGQQIAEMRGDLRLQSALARAQQNRTTTQAKLNSAKQRLDTVEKDLPVRQEAAKKANETLAAAKKDREEKQGVRDKAMQEKVAAEQIAIETSKAAQTALLARLRAEAEAKTATAAVLEATTRSSLITAAANAAPNDESLKQQAAQAVQAVQTAQAEAKRLSDAVAAPTQTATAAVKTATDAAQVVTTKQKPYTDAETALTTSLAAENLATQQQVIADRELKEAEAAVPTAKQLHTSLEAALAESEKQIEAATAAATAAELPLRSVQFSDDGSLIASAGDFSSVHTWDAETGSALAAFADANAAARRVSFVDESRMVSASADGKLRVWELNPAWELTATIGSVETPEVFSHRITGLSFSADGGRLLVAGGTPSRSGELHVIQVADGKQLLHLPKAHDDVIYAAEFSPDGLRIASAAADKYLRTFDVASGEQLLRMEGHTNYVLGLSWKGDGSQIASASADDSVKIWNSENGDQLRTINNFGRHVTAVHYIGETDTIATGSGNKLVRLYNAQNGGNIRTFGGVQSWVHCVDVTQDGRMVAAGLADGTVILWNGQNGQTMQTLTAQIETEAAEQP